MKVKEVLSLVANNLGNEELLAQVTNAVGETTGEVRSLLRCFHLVENEIALDYFPLRMREEVECERGALPFSFLSYSPVSITQVTQDGKSLPFETFPLGVMVSDSKNGYVTVEYFYSPSQKQLNDDVELTQNISARLLSFGVASEYCLTRGEYEEAATWDKKYREALKAASILRKKLAIKARRWS